MKKQLLILSILLSSAAQLCAMQSGSTPVPSVPRYNKPLPAVPQTTGQPAQIGAQSLAVQQSQTGPIPYSDYYSKYEKPHWVPANSGIVGQYAVQPTFSNVQLTAEQEHSITKIIENINEIMANNASIARHIPQLVRADLVGGVREGAIIAKKIGSNSAAIANIYKHAERLSYATPEVKSVARYRILAVVNSPEFIESQEGLIEAAANEANLPDIIKAPLQGFIKELSKLPGKIIEGYLQTK